MSVRLRTYLLAVLWIGSGFICCARAQPADAPASATPDEIVEWLTGSDSRVMAWGAYFAVENQDTKAVPYLQRLAEQWQPMPIRYDQDGNYVKKSDTDAARERAMYGVLDALIEMHAPVAPEAIPTLAVNSGGQALTLFATLPEPERRTLAESIYAARQPGAEYVWSGAARQVMPATSSEDGTHPLAGFDSFMDQYTTGELIHMAAAILAEDPPPGFAASLMNETTMLLTVSVGAKGQRLISMGGCGDSPGGGTPRGWPKQWTYVVETLWPVQSPVGHDVIVPGVPAITTRRAESSSSCSALGPFSSQDRISLLTEMAGATKLRWALHDWEDVDYTGDPAFQAAVQQAVFAREQAFQSTAAELAAKGWLTPTEAQSARPTIEVQIVDARADKSRALPLVALPFARTQFVGTDGH